MAGFTSATLLATYHPLDPMQSDLLIVLVGLASGFSSSAPLGPINFWLTDSVIGRKHRSVRWFIAGVILADVGHALAACWGYVGYLRHAPWASWLPLVGGLLLMAIGLKSLRSSFRPDQVTRDSASRESLSSVSQRPQFTLGFLMCALNPAFLAFWVTVIDLLRERVGIVLSSMQIGLFVLSIILGDMLWFSLLLFLSKKGRDLASPKVLRLIRRGIALFFIGIGVSTVVIQGNIYLP